MATITYAEYARFTDHALAAFTAKVWQGLRPATAEEARDGRAEFLNRVVMIVDALPSARRHEMDTTASPGWQGGNTVSVITMSAADQARVPGLIRTWRQAS
jgi:hypothetical protein